MNSKKNEVEDYVSIDSLDGAEHFAEFTCTIGPKRSMTTLIFDLFRVFLTAQCDQVKFGRSPEVDMQNADDKMQMRKIMRHDEKRLEKEAMGMIMMIKRMQLTSLIGKTSSVPSKFPLRV